LGHYAEGNRKLAVAALLRTDGRAAALVEALEAGKVTKAMLAPEHRQALLSHKDEALRLRATKLLM
jgi:hypothetical protein